VSTEPAGSDEIVADPAQGDDRPLRVCVVAVIAHGIGGMQRHTHDLVRGLVADGHDVEVVCPRAEELTPELYGARWNLVDTTGRSDPAWREKFVDTYLAAAARRPFDVIHSESTSALPLMKLGALPPVVVNYHGNYLGLARAHLRRMAKRPRTALGEGKGLADATLLHFRRRNATVFRNCVSIVVSHQQVADTARSHFLSRELIHVVPNGIDPAAFAPGVGRSRAELGLPDALIFVGVGRLARDKGFDVAIEAFAPVARERSDAVLVIVGDGDERARLGALVDRLGIAHAVRLVGAVEHANVAGYLAASDVFLFPTLRDEAAPLVLPEAMACGLPVVASRIGGITEVLDAAPGREASGLLLRPGDTDALAAALNRLAADADLRAHLGRLALQRFRAEYTLERMIERTVDVYRIAVARG